MRTSDFEKLKVFAAVAERGSFVKAAGWLGLSTSSVSQAIRTYFTRSRGYQIPGVALERPAEARSWREPETVPAPARQVA